jgi:hypothetical protein
VFLLSWRIATALNIKIERRPLPKREFKTQIQPPVVANNARPATEQELYDAGFTVREIRKDGKTCFIKQGKIGSCFIEIYE